METQLPTVQTEIESSTTIPVLSIKEEADDARNWKKSCPIGTRGEIQTIDMKVIEPYKKVISHAGYYHHYNTVQLSKNNVPSGELLSMFFAFDN